MKLLRFERSEKSVFKRFLASLKMTTKIIWNGYSIPEKSLGLNLPGFKNLAGF
jgi:hypothetical protein